jgi:hypothetical protein
MLVLQQLFTISDEGLEFQVNDRRSFEEFVDECFEGLLKLAKFESLIHEKGARNHPLSRHSQETKSAQVGKIERNEAWWSLKNQTSNFLHFLQRSDPIAVVA